MTELERYQNALKWVRHIATVHYMGGAFDPEHMGALADLATNALGGEDLDDYDQAMAAAKIKAKEWAIKAREWAAIFAEDQQS